jgi:hypothetical protein
MGKNAEIHRINNIWGQPKDITVSINIFQYPHFVNIDFCAIRNLKDKKDVVHLGGPSGITYKFCWNPFPPIYELEDAIVMDEIDLTQREMGGIANKVLSWEEENLEIMRMNVEVWEALQGQVD